MVKVWGTVAQIQNCGAFSLSCRFESFNTFITIYLQSFVTVLKGRDKHKMSFFLFSVTESVLQ